MENKHRSENLKFSVGFSKLSHIVTSLLSPAASVYFEKNEHVL